MAEPLELTAEAIRRRLSSTEDQELTLVVQNSGIVGPSLLLHQLSLHLPRFSPDHATCSRTVLNEAQRLASRLSILQAPHLACVAAASASITSRELVFSAVSENVARTIHEAFHYLLSFRENSSHFGLSSPASTNGWPMAMCSVSQFDLLNMGTALADRGFASSEAVVLSRVYAFPGTPQNSITLLFGRIRDWLRQYRPKIKVLLTYVNPNIGFTGASYRADNWSLLGREQTRYAYWAEDYITEREIDRRKLRGDPRLAQSRCVLKPLNVLFRPVKRPYSAFERAAPLSPWSA
ncbi:MAG TPA: hypothetical protein VHC90_25020 [Bryobacteraceae bacterium]|nr:hypothetical protein [Bryobacteraceae bacterium]